MITELRIRKARYRITVNHFLADAFAGGCDKIAKVIMISSFERRKRDRNATAWHEILHAIEEEYGIELGHKVIEKLEYALAEVHEQICAKPFCCSSRRRRA